MNVVLWFLQAVLAFLYVSGGAFKLFQYEQLMQVPSSAALPQLGWYVIGAFELVGAALLIAPAALKKMPQLTPIAATALAVETLALAATHANYSTVLVTTNPLTWSLVMGFVAAFVAYGRFKLEPIGR